MASFDVADGRAAGVGAAGAPGERLLRGKADDEEASSPMLDAASPLGKCGSTPVARAGRHQSMPMPRQGCCRRRRGGAATPVHCWGAESSAVPNADDIDQEWLSQFPLSTEGRHVVDRHGRRFKLSGVNWYGASDAHHVVGGLDVQALPRICEIVRELGFSVVRLPFSNEMLRAEKPEPGSVNFDLNQGLVGKTPLEIFDEVVRELGRQRVAVIINNHTTFGTWCGGPGENGLWFVANRETPWGAHTEAQWIEDWLMLASRYACCPQVVGYDLRNEVRATPARIGPGRALPWLRWPVCAGDIGGSPDGESWLPSVRVDWVAAAARCAARLQAVNPDPLIVVERIVWPQRGLARYVATPGPLLPRFGGKLVLGVHSYSWTAPGVYVVKWAIPQRFRPVMAALGMLGVITWRNHADRAAESPAELKALMRKEWGWVIEQERCPVWVSEFGGNLGCPNEMTWLEAFVSILRDYDADWAYWPLNVGPKPGSGGSEPYGMLTDEWEPPPKDADRRLVLLQSIMAPSVLGCGGSAE